MAKSKTKKEKLQAKAKKLKLEFTPKTTIPELEKMIKKAEKSPAKSEKPAGKSSSKAKATPKKKPTAKKKAADKGDGSEEKNKTPNQLRDEAREGKTRGQQKADAARKRANNKRKAAPKEDAGEKSPEETYPEMPEYDAPSTPLDKSLASIGDSIVNSITRVANRTTLSDFMNFLQKSPQYARMTVLKREPQEGDGLLVRVVIKGEETSIAVPKVDPETKYVNWLRIRG